jgi:large subunit ribosomal protein L25
METAKLQAENRLKSGKGVSRQLRLVGKIPAVFYGKDEPTRSLAVSPKALLAAMSGELGINQVIQLDIEGQTHLSIVADYQYHPVTRSLLHADFYKVDDTTLVDIEVPLEVTGKAKGLVVGGRLRTVFRKVPVRCLPQNIPAKVIHDVTDLDIEQHFTAGDLKLPEGVEVRIPKGQTLGGCYGHRKTAEDLAEEAKAETPAAAGKAAAAGGKAPAKAAAAPKAAAPAKK